MRGLKALFLACVFLLMFIAGVLLTLNNKQAVSVDMILWQSPTVPLGMLMVLVLFVGCLGGVLMNSWLVMRLSQQRRKLQKQLDQASKRFEQLQ